MKAWVELYAQKTAISLFELTFGGFKGNVRTSSIAGGAVNLHVHLLLPHSGKWMGTCPS